MAVIKVDGEASRKIRAERGTVRLSLRVSGPEQAEVLSNATKTHTALATAAQGHVDAGSATQWEAESVTVWRTSGPMQHDFGGEPPEGQVPEYRAGGIVRVEFRDSDALGAFVAEAGALPNVNVEGVTWQVTDETRVTVERDVRIAAGKDAVARATAYAHALGLGAPALDELIEERSDFDFSGPRRRAVRKPTRRGTAMLATTADSEDLAAGEDGEPERFSLRPPEITVSAGVSATFTAN